jgi:hypothetical protein
VTTHITASHILIDFCIVGYAARRPAAAASAVTSPFPGVATAGGNSSGAVLVAGRHQVPKPAAGTTAVLGTHCIVIDQTLQPIVSIRWRYLRRRGPVTWSSSVRHLNLRDRFFNVATRTVMIRM